jgi:hypothetical protein
MIDVALPYTCGMWKDSKAVTLELKEGRNTLEFTANPSNKGISIKQFTLKPVSK